MFSTAESLSQCSLQMTQIFCALTVKSKLFYYLKLNPQTQIYIFVFDILAHICAFVLWGCVAFPDSYTSVRPSWVTVFVQMRDFCRIWLNFSAHLHICAHLCVCGLGAEVARRLSLISRASICPQCQNVGGKLGREETPTCVFKWDITLYEDMCVPPLKWDQLEFIGTFVGMQMRSQRVYLSVCKWERGHVWNIWPALCFVMRNIWDESSNWKIEDCDQSWGKKIKYSFLLHRKMSLTQPQLMRYFLRVRVLRMLFESFGKTLDERFMSPLLVEFQGKRGMKACLRKEL